MTSSFTRSLRNSWIAVAVALFAVVVSGTFIIKHFLRHVFVDCKGTLVSVPASELSSEKDNGFAFSTYRDNRTELEVRYDTIEPNEKEKSSALYAGLTRYKNVRIVWNRSESSGVPGDCACADIPVKWEAQSTTSPSTLRIRRDDTTGVYAVQPAHSADPIAVFRKVDNKGRRFQSERVFEANNMALLVFFFALGALGIAGFRVLRAAPYASRMHAWRSGTLRPDGVVEGDTGSTLGMMENRSRIPAGKVIVDPSALEGRDIYREMPILTKKQVGAGSHERWTEGTWRRLRDARSLAILATMATGLSLIASFLGS